MKAMKEGDILLAALQQADGVIKYRPALLLRRMPPFQDLLVCGISTQLHLLAPELDELITPDDPDYRTSGLKSTSLVRLGYLAVLPHSEFKGRIGAVAPDRMSRLLLRLSNFLRPASHP